MVLKDRKYAIAWVLGLFITACSKPVPYDDSANQAGHTAPTKVTLESNQAVLAQRPFDDTIDFEFAHKGFIARDENLVIRDDKGNIIWDMSQFGFIDPEKRVTSGSVNPSLWRQAELNNIHGLFEVTEGVYQIRGFDLATMSIIKGQKGWIIVDPLTSKETAAKAFQFVQKHLGKRPVTAILFTHSHIDHFGGVQGILDNLSGNQTEQPRIIAPDGFVEEATSENIIAGLAMGRRSEYMYGNHLKRDERGHVDAGLGKSPAIGELGFAVPTDIVDETTDSLMIDGIEFNFQIVSNAEAPSGLVFYLPQFKAFCGGELVSRTMHNLYTLRGAKVRDALIWSHFIEQARLEFGQADVLFFSHHWPLWGQDKINDFMEKQRDTYKFIHDQTVRLLNHGYTPNEIADQLSLPPSLMEDFHNQGYYGTIQHNSKAVYQFYMGWYQGNPAKLHPLPEPELAIRYIEMMGGVNAVVTKATEAFESASTDSYQEATRTYRWLAELLNHAVFAEPTNTGAKALLAKIYDQLGYQAESAPWRNVYLTAAYELRHGTPEETITPAEMKDILLSTPLDSLLGSMAVTLNADKAEGVELDLKIHFTDKKETYLLSLKNAVLRHALVSKETPSDITLSITMELLIDIIVGHASIREVVFGDDLSVEGSTVDLMRFINMLDQPSGMFNIVTP